METLKFYSIKLIKLHIPSTLPFYISSCRNDKIIFEYLLEINYNLKFKFKGNRIYEKIANTSFGAQHCWPL